jgi:hypothetical protein
MGLDDKATFGDFLPVNLLVSHACFAIQECSPSPTPSPVGEGLKHPLPPGEGWGGGVSVTQPSPFIQRTLLRLVVSYIHMPGSLG